MLSEPSNSEYLSELALSLRRRRLGEAVVRQELTKVASDGEAGAEREAPEEYASRFSKGSVPPLGAILTNVLAAIAVLTAFARIFSGLILRVNDSFWVSVAIYVCAFVVLVAAPTIGNWVDRRVPRNLR